MERSRLTSPAATALDLGPDRHGHVAAVYSRCGARGRRCDVYAYDFATRAERRVGVAATKAHSETHPTLCRGRIAYVQDAADDKRTGRIVLATLRGRRTIVPGGRPSDEPKQETAQPADLELRGRTLAFTWYRQSYECPPDPADKEDLGETVEVWLGPRRFARACDGFVGSPSLTAAGLGYLREPLGDPAVLRRRTATGALVGDVDVPGAIDADQDGATIAFVRWIPKTETTPDQFVVVRLG